MTEFSEIKHYLQAQLSALESQPLDLDVGLCADANEFASAVTDSHIKTAIHARNTARIGEIQAALRKMEHAGYGYCEACGEPISLARLKARPTAQLCVECQSALEKAV